MLQHIRQLMAGHLASPASQFVGRQRELTVIRDQYKAAQSGYTRVVFLTGEPGIGKTRLLDEVATYTVQEGVTVLHGGASEAEGMPPYLPFLEALGQHARTASLDQLRKQVTVAPQMLMSILPELATRLGELPESYMLLPEQTRLRLYEAIGAFLEAISVQHGLVLTLDDLQSADSASLDLLCRIVRYQPTAKLLILGTYREAEINHNPALERTVTELIRSRVLTTVAVEPLSSEEIGELASSYLGGPISPTMSHFLFMQSEGNPFFAEELLRGWLEKGTLVQKNKQWVLVGSLEHALPAGIVGTLRQRFMRLSSDIIDHLRIAAVIGRTFDLSLLAAVECQEIEAIEERLLAAVDARLVRIDQADKFTFTHDKIRECLYAEVSTLRRRRLHEHIGKVLEAQYDQQSPKSAYLLAELAFHFTHSSDRMRGATYSLLAAEEALRRSAIEEALAHYHTALELLEPDDERNGHLHLSLGDAALLAGRIDEAAVAYQAALEWLSRYGDLEAAARAAHSLGLVQWDKEALQSARASFECALMLLEKHQNARVVRVQVDLSMLLTICLHQPAEGGAYADQALEIAHRLRDKSCEAAARRAIAGKLYASGNDLSSVLQSLERALVLAEESDNHSEAAECCLYLAAAYYCKAEIRRSYEICLRGIEFIKHYPEPFQSRKAYFWLAFLLASQGAWAETEQEIEHVSHLPDPHPLIFLKQIQGFLAYQREDYDAAEREFLAAKVSQQQEPGRSVFPVGFPGIILVALGKHKEANASIAELEALLHKMPADTLPTAPVIAYLALIAVALGDQERAAELYQRLLPFSGQYYCFLIDHILGEIAALCGDRERARSYLYTAAAVARLEGLRPELAHILLKQADIERAIGNQGSLASASNYLKQALAIFEELNMIVARDRTRSRLRALLHHSNGSTHQSLTNRITKSEARVLQLVAQGKSNRHISQELGISEKTVANHLTHIFNKTMTENRAAAAAFAIRNGLD